jgi:carboxyl-terminal processing protease
MERTLTKIRHSRHRWLALAAFGLLSAQANGTTTMSQDELLFPEERHENIGELVTQFIQKSHYNQVAVDDKLSSRVLDTYIESLDRNRMYLLASDIESFEKNREILDDVVKSKPLDPVFEMYEVYRTRVRERLTFALTQLENEPNYLSDEEYEFDRSDSPWAASTAELDEIWRHRVINDALSLALEDESWEKIQDVLTSRYKGFIKRLGQVNNDDVFERFMSAFSRTLDAHSTYFSPRQAEENQIQLSLSYFGIGASLQTEDDFVKIVGIIPGGPAAIDGKLQPNDRITGVAQGLEGDMQDVIGWRLDDVVDLIRGPAESIVRLEIIPANAPPGSPKKIIGLTRDQVKLEEQAVKGEVRKVPRDGREWSIGVIDVPSFYRDFRALSNGDKNYTSTTKDVKKLISELEEQGIDGLVIDMRGNRGGLLSEATGLSGLFIDNGPVVQLRNTNGRIIRLDDPDPVARVAYSGPLVVLVNRFSASASEIFAAAIQDYARGVIVGQQTFGKGTVQSIYSLDQYLRSDDGRGFGQLTLTMGKYYRVTGESTQHRGVEPDIELPSAIDADLVGESAEDNVLPWDTVQTTRFRKGKPLNNTIASLTASYTERSKEDPNFRYQMDTIEAAEEARSQKTISLNIEQRRTKRQQELDRRLERENARRTALGIEPVENLDDIDAEERPDVLLDQAAGIATDLATMREIETRPSQTARAER